MIFIYSRKSEAFKLSNWKPRRRVCVKLWLAESNATPIAECEWPQSSKLNKLLTLHKSHSISHSTAAARAAQHVNFTFILLFAIGGLQRLNDLRSAPKATSTIISLSILITQEKCCWTWILKLNKRCTRLWKGATCAWQARRKWQTHVRAQISLLAFCTPQGFFAHASAQNNNPRRMAAREVCPLGCCWGFSPYWIHSRVVYFKFFAWRLTQYICEAERILLLYICVVLTPPHEIWHSSKCAPKESCAE